MANTLVIVESPAKAKTITRYLGQGYTVRASMGHVRDLPSKRLGVEVEKGTFQPEYETISGRYKTISEIRSLAKEAGQVLLATDPDREGEAIAWHIVAAAGLGRGRQQISRVEFHEITERAIKTALANPRSLDMNLINAQQARRVLDRLVGYKLSPLLWKKVQKGTSAGRVQSVALRVVVERERAIETFVPREFWTVEADLARSPFSGRKGDIFRATLWDPKENQKREFEKGDQAQNIVDQLEGASWKVAKIAKKEVARHPSPPFITSTLQQEAARKLRLKTQDTMKIAQQLYEGISLGPEGTTGLITYMRTDSTQVAYEAQQAAREVIKDHFGSEYLPERPPRYRQVKGAQEAHEAIRPTKPARDPDSIKQWLSPQQYQLYRLIWRRFIASQMAPARLEQTTVDIEATPKIENRRSKIKDQKTRSPEQVSTELYIFRASGERVIFPGFMAVYREGRGDSEEEESEASGLPVLTANDPLDLLKLLAEQHFTEPPPRYGEASLVKALEELGVGRPSTYATILATLRERAYVIEQKEGKERKFHPTALGRAVNDLLVARFPDLLDVKFTARLETELDEVADGKRQWTPLVAAVYGPLMEHLKQAEKEVAKIEVPAETLPASEPEPARSYKRGASRTGSGASRTRRPKMYTESRSGTASRSSTATRPRRATRATTAKAKVEPNLMEQAPSKPRPAKTRQPEPVSIAVEGPSCPTCNKPMVKRKGPYSEFWGCSGYPNCKGTRKL